jgi:hypothetical protein
VPRRPHIFTSERGQAFTRFAINKMIGTAAGADAGKAGLPHGAGMVRKHGGREPVPPPVQGR